VAGQAVTGHVFNISGGEVLPITEIVAAVCQRVGLQARWQRMPLAPLMIAAGVMEALTARLPGAREPAVTRYGLALFAYAQSLDLAKAHRGLGWRPQVTFADGLSRSFPQGAA
jgi:nucleoside-diphosphate-sugar epimerase